MKLDSSGLPQERRGFSGLRCMSIVWWLNDLQLHYRVKLPLPLWQSWRQWPQEGSQRWLVESLAKGQMRDAIEQ
jgi:hypothetical protein